jgi:hypothetical protein
MLIASQLLDYKALSCIGTYSRVSGAVMWRLLLLVSATVIHNLDCFHLKPAIRGHLAEQQPSLHSLMSYLLSSVVLREGIASVGSFAVMMLGTKCYTYLS